MAEKEGWVSLHRKLQDNFLWRERRVFSKAEAWIDILMEVNHAPNKVLIENSVIDCDRGQSVKSLETWQKRWNWKGKKQVRDFLMLLQNQSMIRYENVTKTIRITICNYDTYQDRVNAKETQRKRNVNAKETQRKPNNNDNNDNNDNKIPFDVFWDAYDKKVGSKVKLSKKWDKLKEEEQVKVLKHIELYKESQPDKQFRKNPETYLNNKSWNDEIIKRNNGTSESIFGTSEFKIKQGQSLNQLQTTPTSNEISIYQGKLTQKGFAEQTAKILQAFPKMPTQTFELLKDRFKANGFTDERLADAVGHVIDTYEGWDKLPNIANFISFDKKVRLFTYPEVCTELEYYSAVDVGIAQPRYVRLEDSKYFKAWEFKTNKMRAK